MCGLLGAKNPLLPTFLPVEETARVSRDGLRIYYSAKNINSMEYETA